MRSAALSSVCGTVAVVSLVLQLSDVACVPVPLGRSDRDRYSWLQ